MAKRLTCPAYRDPRVRATVAAAAAAAALAAVAALPLQAQQKPESREAFHGAIRVPVVNVDVMVTDRRGSPVAGLTAGDFAILVDGKSVEITHFYAAPRAGGQLREATAATAPAVVEETTAPRVDVPAEQQLHMVIYIDHTNHDADRLRTAMELIERFVSDSVPAHVPIMMVSFDTRLRVCQPFTRDREQLLSALECCRSKARTRLDLAREKKFMKRRISQTAAQELPPNDPHRDQWEAEVVGLYNDIEQAFDEIARDQTRVSLEGLRHCIGFVSDLPGRKTILFVSDGIDPRATQSMFQVWRTTFSRQEMFAVTRELRQALQRSMPRSLGYPHGPRELRELVREANSHRVGLYTLTSLSDRLARQRSAELVQSAAFDASFAEMSEEIILYQMAGLTGGRVLVHGPQLPEQLVAVADEGLDGYSLAFSPSTPGDGGYHAIEVKVNRAGVKVRHREGYRDTADDDRLVARTLAAAAIGVADNPLGVMAEILGQERREDGTVVVDVLVRVPIAQLVLMPRRGLHEGKASLCLVVRDGSDRLSTIHREEFPIEIPDAQYDEAITREAGFRKAIGLRQGAQVLAAGVRDEVGRVESTVILELAIETPES